MALSQRRLVLLALACSLMAGSLAACDTDADESGQFDAEVRAGAGTGIPLVGRAFFSADSSAGTFTIKMVLRAERSVFREGVVLARAGTGPPEEGQRYALTAPGPDGLPGEAFAGALLLSFGGSDPALYYAADGTLEVHAVTTGHVEGTFGFVAELVQASGSVEAPTVVEVTGSFDAARGRTDPFPR